MKLASQLQATRAIREKRYPPDLVAAQSEGFRLMKQAHLAKQAKGVGELAPDFELPDLQGHLFSLQAQLAQGAVVLTFFPGSWDPYSGLQLDALQQIQPRLRELGATLIAVTPQQHRLNLMLLQRHGLSFPLLRDFDNQVARRFGVAVELPSVMIDYLEQLGMDVPEFNQTPHWVLPMPATYVIAPDGQIRYAFVDEDFSLRAEPSEVLSALQHLGRVR